jgi:hypothetical protein
MMYSLFKSITTLNIQVPLLHTYDIYCQFVQLFWEHFKDLPSDLQQIKICNNWWTHLILKMHLLGHTRKCQAPYLLSYAFGARRTCDKAIERMWALMNGIALSVRKMGAGFCSNWIDSHMAHHNWLKHTKMGKSSC